MLTEVSDRIRGSGSIGKADIGALLFWKRLRADTRWVRELMVMAEAEVRGTAAAPDRMAVYDRRAQTGLEKLGLSLSPARVRYGRYMTIVVGLASEAERRGHPWSPRQVDLALYALGGQKRIS